MMQTTARQSVTGTGWGATLSDLAALLFAFFALMLATTDMGNFAGSAGSTDLQTFDTSESTSLSAGYLALLIAPAFEEQVDGGVIVRHGAGSIRIDLGAPEGLRRFNGALEDAIARLSHAGFDISLRLAAPVPATREGWRAGMEQAADLARRVAILGQDIQIAPELVYGEEPHVALLAYRARGGEWQ